MDILFQLLGRLHPLAVHLPVGFIVLGVLLQWYDRKQQQYRHIISLIYLWAGYSAILACITGYLQYLEEGYAFDSVKWHLWGGIATSVFCFIAYFGLHDFKKVKILKALRMVSPVVFAITGILLVSYTGHAGGTITHGEEYLSEPLPDSLKELLGMKTTVVDEVQLEEDNWAQANLYQEVVAPIFKKNCVSCHNPDKSKGDFQMHTPEMIMQGGESGMAIVAADPEKSSLYARMILPVEHEDHMPPKSKRQPSKEEIALIEAWIKAGHPFEMTVGEAGLDKALVSPFFARKHNANYPEKEVVAASQGIIDTIKAQNIHIENISKATNYLNVTCINKPSFSDKDINLLKPIADQIAILDLGGTAITDAVIKDLVAFKNLTVLKLDHTSLTGNDLSLLSSLRHLKTINLTATRFDPAKLNSFENFEGLEKVFLFQTAIDKTGTEVVNNGRLIVDYGNYDLPEIPSDTIVY